MTPHSSDQGWHYKMRLYRQTLTEREFTQIMSSKGKCYNNAIIENFFDILKSKFLYTQGLNNQRRVKKYIEYYKH